MVESEDVDVDVASECRCDWCAASEETESYFLLEPAHNKIYLFFASSSRRLLPHKAKPLSS